MDIRKLEENLSIISGLEDEPNDEGGMSAAQLKAKFDEGGNIIKGYINGRLIPDVKAKIKDQVNAAVLESGNLPLGGKKGQVITKRSDDDFDMGFSNVDELIDTSSEPTPDTFVVRDSEGRTQSAEPATGADVATKSYVDNLHSTILSPETGLKLGLESSTPAEAFEALSFAGQYVWSRREHPYALVLSDTEVNVEVTTGSTRTAGSATYYADESGHAILNYRKSGRFNIADRKAMSTNYDTYMDLASLKGTFWAKTDFYGENGAPAFYYTPADGPDPTRGITDSLYRTYLKAYPVTFVFTNHPSETLYSPDPDTYPKGEDEFYDYKFYGKFAELPLLLNDSIVCGVYTGNGDYQRTINLGFTPRAILVVRSGYLFNQSGSCSFALRGSGVGSYGEPILAVVEDGFRIYYKISSTQQSNANNSIYHFIAWR